MKTFEEWKNKLALILTKDTEHDMRQSWNACAQEYETERSLYRDTIEGYKDQVGDMKAKISEALELLNTWHWYTSTSTGKKWKVYNQADNAVEILRQIIGE